MDDEVLFSEQGASWYWVLMGPGSALSMLGIQIWSGAGADLMVPLTFLVLVTGFVALQIKAARIHTSVELTRTYLREGTQTINVDEIVKIYPAPTGASNSRYDGSRFAKRGGGMLADRAMRRAGIDLSDLEEPEPEPAPDTDTATVLKWQSSRALGELTGVPRGRTGIGIRLTGDRIRQAWARNHRGLRDALTPLVEERV